MLQRLHLFSLLGLAFLLAGAPPARAQLSTSELLVRIDRLESQLRQMNGRIEQLEFRNRELETRLKRQQDDAEFRFKELESKPAARPPAGNPRRTEAPPAEHHPRTADPRASDLPPVASAPEAVPAAPRRGEPPRNLGTLPQNAPPAANPDDEEADSGPLDLGTLSRQAAEDPRLAPPPAQPDIIAPTTTPRDEYDLALNYLKRKEYQLAEQGFRRFIQTYPRDRLVADATFGLGEAYYGRALYREAAENYLKVTTEYPRSGRGAESMLRLAMALNRLGEKDTACATFAAIGSKYPNAPNTRKRAEDEQKRAGCPA